MDRRTKYSKQKGRNGFLCMYDNLSAYIEAREEETTVTCKRNYLKPILRDLELELATVMELKSSADFLFLEFKADAETEEEGKESGGRLGD